MPDETKPKDLETVLARLQNEWRELAGLLITQAKSQDRVIEVEQILLRDAFGPISRQNKRQSGWFRRPAPERPRRAKPGPAWG